MSIETESDYRNALERISILMDKDPEPNSSYGLQLTYLIDAVVEYEDEHYPID